MTGSSKITTVTLAKLVITQDNLSSAATLLQPPARHSRPTPRYTEKEQEDNNAKQQRTENAVAHLEDTALVDTTKNTTKEKVSAWYYNKEFVHPSDDLITMNTAIQETSPQMQLLHSKNRYILCKIIQTTRYNSKKVPTSRYTTPSSEETLDQVKVPSTGCSTFMISLMIMNK
eukprot:15265092-Ditylum_brightwellii.AAC.1